MAENIIHNIENLSNEIEFANNKKEIKKCFIELMQIINDNFDLKTIFNEKIKEFELLKNEKGYNEILKKYKNTIKELNFNTMPLYFYNLDFEFIDLVDFIYNNDENLINCDGGILYLYDNIFYKSYYNFSLKTELLSICDKINNSYPYYYLSKRYGNQMSSNDRFGYYILVKAACIKTLKELKWKINDKKEKTKKDLLEDLTNKEQEIFEYMCINLNEGVKQIAEHFSISTTTVQTHINNITDKLSIDRGIKSLKKYCKKQKS